MTAGPFTIIDTPWPWPWTKKSVTLNPIVLVHEIDTKKTMTKEEKSELYNTKDELILTTNLEVKAICALSNQLPQSASTPYFGDQDRNTCVLAVEADGFLRGLEFYIYPQRLRNKILARRALLKYQTHLQIKYPDITPDQRAKATRTASEKLSAWSYLAAQETARLDSLRAYDGDYLVPLDDDQQVRFSPFADLAVKLKRKGSFEEVPQKNDFVSPLPFKKARVA
jgi:hypothetical protein